MSRTIATLAFAALVSVFVVSPSLAGCGPPAIAPAPLLGAGLPGLAIFAVTGGGYLVLRTLRRRRDD